jgi:N-methylhydantoinase B
MIPSKTDPVTLEVLRSAFPAIPDEMSHVLRRTSYNLMIYEVGDYSCAILDAEGNLIAQNAGGVSHFVADLGPVIRDGCKRLEFAPGDVVITNHQAVCGQHLNNVCVYMPFFSGDRLAGFAINRAHWIDIGGYSTGSGAGRLATDPWLEGLQLDQVKIYEGGRPIRPMLDLISTNIRYPESSMGDLRAQISSCQLGVKRLGELYAKYGDAVATSAIGQIFDETEARCRKIVENFADGTYEFTTSFDDGAEAVDGPLVIHARVIVAGDAMTIDLSGCAKQRHSIFNSRTLAAPYIAYKALTLPLEPVNEGAFRALNVILPEGTFMMAHFPAAMASWSAALPTVIDAILAALAPALPDRIPAAHKGYLGDQITFFGKDPQTGKNFIAQSIEGGGWGGRPFEDGPSASVTICQGDVRNSPIEALEQRCPVILERRELRTDSAGAGKFRGGFGHTLQLRGLVPGKWNLPLSGRHKNPAWGLWGGGQGQGGARRVRLPGTDEWIDVDAFQYAVPAQTGVIIQSSGGGGWGNPLERDAAAVLRDVIDGLTSLGAAREQYGVVIVDGAIDRAATDLLRSQRSQTATG